jgi:hypothetical protein
MEAYDVQFSHAMHDLAGMPAISVLFHLAILRRKKHE